jgi:hypothetical protein
MSDRRTFRREVYAPRAHYLKNLDLQTIERLTTTRTIKTRNKLCLHHIQIQKLREFKYSLRLVLLKEEPRRKDQITSGKLTQNFDTLEGADPILNLP